MLQARVAASPALPAYRESVGKDLPWKQLSWDEVGAAVMQYRCALQRSGIVHADRVGIWLPNSIYAMCMDQAALQIGAIAVPVALLHKSSLRRVTPNPGRGYATAAV